MEKPRSSSLAVVLVAPEIAANLGFIARTMACYGLDDLRIVGRPGLALSEEARRIASGGEAVLSGTREFSTLPEAIADCAFAFGFSRRSRDPSQEIIDLSAVVGLDWRGAATALVFGRESIGLTREDTLSVSHLVRIPMASETLSLNLSHAVAIALFAFSGAPGPVNNRLETSTLGEADSVLAEGIARLSERGYFKDAKAEAQQENIRMLWRRLNPTRRELEFIAGLLKKLGEPPKF